MASASAGGANSHGAIAPVRHDNVAGHVSREIGCEEDGWSGDILRCADTVQRSVAHTGGDHVGVLGSGIGVDSGRDHARPDRIHPYALFAEFRGEASCEGEHTMLRGRVGCGVWPTVDMYEGLDRANIDDPALCRAQLIEVCVRDV